jgi:hypothetical protein
MATRHVYDVDDVAATTAYGLLTGDPILAARAARELVLSGESERLFRLLTFLWVLDTPDHMYESQRSAAFIAGDVNTFFYTMASSTPRNLPPLPLPVTTTPSTSDDVKYIQPPPDDTSDNLVHADWKTRPSEWTKRQSSRFIKRIRMALRKGDAWNPTELSLLLLRPARNLDALCSFLDMLGVHTSFIELLRTVPFDPLLEHVLGHAYASLCPAESPPHLQPPQKAVAIYKDTTTATGGRKGRTFHVPSAALNMWRVRSRSLPRWTGAPLFVADDAATSYWVDLCKQYKITMAHGNLVSGGGGDDAAFYDAAFPDDIPDEWEAAEWSKSHDISVNPEQNVWHPGFMMYL